MKCSAGVLVMLLGLVGPTAARAQTPSPTGRIVGDRISGHMQIDGRTRMVTETATLTFQHGEQGEIYTIDFITQHLADQPVALSGAVDIVVTEHPVADDMPEMTWRVDGEPVRLTARVHGQRAVVATVSVGELDRIANAGLVVERTFNAELEFGPGQVRMLRNILDRWLGRAR